MEFSASDNDETFEVSDSLDSVSEASDNEGANVCRVAAIATMLSGSRAAVQDVGDALSALGFASPLSSDAFNLSDLEWLELLDRVDVSTAGSEIRTRTWLALQTPGGQTLRCHSLSLSWVASSSASLPLRLPLSGPTLAQPPDHRS